MDQLNPIHGIIMDNIEQSDKLSNVCYDIRGPVLEEAKRLEEEGHQILKLNIGNPAPFGFNAPDEILYDVIHNLSNAQGYSDSKGIYSADFLSSLTLLDYSSTQSYGCRYTIAPYCLTGMPSPHLKTDLLARPHPQIAHGCSAA